MENQIPSLPLLQVRELRISEFLKKDLNQIFLNSNTMLFQTFSHCHLSDWCGGHLDSYQWMDNFKIPTNFNPGKLPKGRTILSGTRSLPKSSYHKIFLRAVEIPWDYQRTKEAFFLPNWQKPSNIGQVQPKDFQADSLVLRFYIIPYLQPNSYRSKASWREETSLQSLNTQCIATYPRANPFPPRARPF